jgi:hypothetical protein
MFVNPPVVVSALALCLVVSTGTRSAAAAGNKKAECAAAYEHSQELRASSKLHEARDAMVICAQDACPSFVQSDCTQWLSDIQREMPTVVVAAKDASGSDVSNVKVTIDGGPVEPDNEGRAVAVDPGRHVFRFELEGAVPIERQIVVRQGEKDRVIEVTFESTQGAPLATEQKPPSALASTPIVDAEMSDVTKPGPLRPYAYVAGGIGAAGLVGFTVLGLVARGQKSDLESSGCKPNCSRDTVDGIRTKVVLADISLGLGVAGIGTGLALFFLSRPRATRPSDTVSFDLKTTRDGAYATVYGAF